MTYSNFGGIVEVDLQRKVSREMPRFHAVTLSYRAELQLGRPGVRCNQTRLALL